MYDRMFRVLCACECCVSVSYVCKERVCVCCVHEYVGVNVVCIEAGGVRRVSCVPASV